MDLADKLKMALDEGRLLILGAQVVFGCQFQMVFQERFQDAPRDSQAVQGIGLLALMLAVGLLITPSMTHQIAYRGEDRKGALRVASTCAGLAMVPMTLGLGATTFVVFESLFNRNVGVVAGITFAAVAFLFLYALGLILRIGHKGQMPPSEKQTLLKNKIEQLLTEARVIIPGAQALLGFQFVVVFVRSFAELPGWVKMTHAVALAAIALSVVLLMTPAALHRIAYDGENSQSFLPDQLGARRRGRLPPRCRYRRGHLRGWVQDNRWRAACFAEWLRIFADPHNVLVLLSALAAPCQRSALLNHGRA